MSTKVLGLLHISLLLIIVSCSSTAAPVSEKNPEEPAVEKITKIQNIKCNDTTQEIIGIEYLINSKTYQLVNYDADGKKNIILDSGFVLKNTREYSNAIFRDVYFTVDGSILLLVDFSKQQGADRFRHLTGYVIQDGQPRTINELPEEILNADQSPYDKNLFLRHQKEDGSLLLIDASTGSKSKLWFPLLRRCTSTVYWGTQKDELLFRGGEYLYFYLYKKNNGKRIKLPDKMCAGAFISMNLSPDNKLLFANVESKEKEENESVVSSCLIDLENCVVSYNTHARSQFADFAHGSSQFIFYRKNLSASDSLAAYSIVERNEYRSEKSIQCEYEFFWMSQ